METTGDNGKVTAIITAGGVLHCHRSGSAGHPGRSLVCGIPVGGAST